jgi:hypothetical protein
MLLCPYVFETRRSSLGLVKAALGRLDDFLRPISLLPVVNVPTPEYRFAIVSQLSLTIVLGYCPGA